MSNRNLRRSFSILFPVISLILEGCAGLTPTPTATPTQTKIPATATRALPTPTPTIPPTPTLLPLFGPVPQDATGSDTVLMQYTKAGPDGETLDYSQELGMWMELHSPPNGIQLIDRNIAFYPTDHDLIPMVVEIDPALKWSQNLIHVDPSDIYWSDRLKLDSFSTLMELELARQAGIDLRQRDTQFYVSALMENIFKETYTIPFQVPGDPQSYNWIPVRGIRVWLVKTGALDQAGDAPIYRMRNGDELKIFEKQGVLEYVISTSSLDQGMQPDGILAKILGPMFEVLFAAKGKLPLNIDSFYGINPKERSPGTLSDMAGKVTVGGNNVPGYILAVGENSQ